MWSFIGQRRTLGEAVSKPWIWPQLRNYTGVVERTVLTLLIQLFCQLFYKVILRSYIWKRKINTQPLIMLLQKENFNENLGVTSSKKKVLCFLKEYTRTQVTRNLELPFLKIITVNILTRKAAVHCIIPHFYNIFFNVIIPLRLDLTNGFTFR